MTRKNKISGICGFLSVLVGFLGKAFYREYMSLNGIDDFGIAGFLPSYFYVLGFSLLLLVRPSKSPGIIILVVTSAALLYELRQYNTSGVFDLYDALASIAGGLSALLAVKMIDRFTRKV